MQKQGSSPQILSWPIKNGPAKNEPTRQYVASFRPAPHLTTDQIHIWTLRDFPGDTAGYASLLSRDEMDRASRFRFPHLYDRYVADHARLRLLLGAYLEADPRSLGFATNEYGKPRIDTPHCRLRFNMSHSTSVTMVALCLNAEVGIDVEAIRPVAEWAAIASSHFSGEENDALNAEPEEARSTAFFRCWTRKEAFIKAKGMGLSLPLNSFSVTVSADTPAALLSCNWDPQESARWTLTHLDPEPGYVGSLAVERKNWSSAYFAWPESETTV
jgi:4'-phosphopantetheinyl transferase